MMNQEVNIYYPKTNFSAFDYDLNNQITERVYTDEGEFIDFRKHNISLKYYQKVGSVLVSRTIENHVIFQQMIINYNSHSKASEITDRIKSGDLHVQHSSFSKGDIIEIGNEYFISDGMLMNPVDL